MTVKNEINFSKMAERWPSEIIARNEVGKFTGGLISGRTMANLDSKNEGIEDRFYMGNKTGYFVKSFINWLEKRATNHYQSPKRRI